MRGVWLRAANIDEALANGSSINMPTADEEYWWLEVTINQQSCYTMHLNDLRHHRACEIEETTGIITFDQANEGDGKI